MTSQTISPSHTPRIQNIVFDMGNVLLSYDPDVICQQTVASEFRTLVKTYLMQGPEWPKMDEGLLSEEEALKQIFVKVRAISSSQDFYEKACHEIKYCLEHWHECLKPITENGQLIRDLKKEGYHIYLCSNAALSFFQYYKNIPAIECFDGLLVSAEEKCVKPRPEIYHRLFEKFEILPEESLFIDDLKANIEGAKRCGMDGYCFADGDTGKLRAWLMERLKG